MNSKACSPKVTGQPRTPERQLPHGTIGLDVGFGPFAVPVPLLVTIFQELYRILALLDALYERQRQSRISTRTTIDELNTASIPYMLIGGLALSAWGLPRATLDIGLTLWERPPRSGVRESLLPVPFPRGRSAEIRRQNPRLTCNDG